MRNKEKEILTALVAVELEETPKIETPKIETKLKATRRRRARGIFAIGQNPENGLRMPFSLRFPS